MIRKQTYLIFISNFFCVALTYSSQPHTTTDEFAKQGIKQVAQVGGQQLNDLINLGKEKYGLISPLQKAQQENMDAQIKLAEKQMELNEQQKILNDKQIALADKQIEDTTLDTHIKKLAAIKETCSMLPRNDPKAMEAIKRSKAELDNIIKNFPPLPEEEAKTKPALENPTKDINTKSSFFALITTPCFIAATKAGDCADFLASYSFGYITNLEYFKDGFIGKHRIGINRTLVVTTLAAATYAAYKLYKAQTHIENDDDIFNDDY